MDKTLGLILVAGAIATMIAACSGDDNSGAKPDAEGLGSTARHDGEDFLSGNFAAIYERYSEACRAAVTNEQLVAALKNAQPRVGTLKVVRVDVRDVTSTDGHARVVFAPAAGGADVDLFGGFDRYIVENGEWHSTDCGADTE